MANVVFSYLHTWQVLCKELTVYILSAREWKHIVVSNVRFFHPLISVMLGLYTLVYMTPIIDEFYKFF